VREIGTRRLSKDNGKEKNKPRFQAWRKLVLCWGKRKERPAKKHFRVKQSQSRGRSLQFKEIERKSRYKQRIIEKRGAASKDQSTAQTRCTCWKKRTNHNNHLLNSGEEQGIVEGTRRRKEKRRTGVKVPINGEARIERPRWGEKKGKKTGCNG